MKREAKAPEVVIEDRELVLLARWMLGAEQQEKRPRIPSTRDQRVDLSATTI